MTGSYIALGMVSALGGFAVLGLAVLLVRLPLHVSAQRAAACEAERRRLGREMHDGLAQELAALGYVIDALAAGARDIDDRVQLEQLRRRVTSLVAETRCSLAGLRLGVDDGLGPALETLAAGLTEAGGIPIEVDVVDAGASTGRPSRRTPEIDGELLRIAQEALNNAVKHAAATTIRVEGELRGDTAHLTITDDGRGFQGHRHGSHGLAVMQERARLIGATLSLGNAPGGGFRVAVSLPAERSGRRRGATVVVPGARTTSPQLETTQ